MSKALQHAGHAIERGRTYQDYRVYFPTLRRVRYGTPAEIRADIDRVNATGSLDPKRQGGF